MRKFSLKHCSINQIYGRIFKSPSPANKHRAGKVHLEREALDGGFETQGLTKGHGSSFPRATGSSSKKRSRRKDEGERMKDKISGVPGEVGTALWAAAALEQGKNEKI